MLQAVKPAKQLQGLIFIMKSPEILAWALPSYSPGRALRPATPTSTPGQPSSLHHPTGKTPQATIGLHSLPPSQTTPASFSSSFRNQPFAPLNQHSRLDTKRENHHGCLPFPLDCISASHAILERKTWPQNLGIAYARAAISAAKQLRFRTEKRAQCKRSP